MAKAYKLGNDKEKLVIVHCPGCDMGHPFRVSGKGPKWKWNGDLIKPTFSPSMLVNKHDDALRCHSFVRYGTINFLNDCHHDLKGQTVELPDLDQDGDPIERDKP